LGPIFAADFTNDSKRSQASGANSSLSGFLGEGLGMAGDPDREKRIKELKAEIRKAKRAGYALDRKLKVPQFKPYWLVLGEFLHYFADIENLLLDVLGNYAGVSVQVSRIIFSGTRVDAA